MSVLTAEQARQACAEEYGEYVAIGSIHLNGVLAFLDGHAVPRSHVRFRPGLQGPGGQCPQPKPGKAAAAAATGETKE